MIMSAPDMVWPARGCFEPSSPNPLPEEEGTCSARALIGPPRPNSSRNRRRLLLRFLKERHHVTQLLADRFDRMGRFRFAHFFEVRTAGFVLLNPLPGERAVLNFSEDLFHCRANMLVDDPRPAAVVTILGRVADGITHVAEA